ncbi:hypothetical protein L202_00021 [Cryptococcus amylolentus CBS 6039]|uniref:DNA polymerase delta subunit 3 n=1 Tax=Cryptococcus amylolentus CBS 6039 TaxID=1295533 RepID=A0A1E3I6K9_9TREE|nr:hypothetical protein L202_00021 [Cryptococcus amylolentus CBS 6039]ODN83985.1 hypothetical protein L202_00021 [Cryptococcus amylolentus CBS 6039]
MATAEQQKQAARKLTYWLESERRIVSYRVLSRELGLHVNVAKDILLKHLQSNPSLSSTYLLSGPLLSSSSLTQTQLSPSHGAGGGGGKGFRDLGEGMVKIVDMDERSDAGSDADADADADAAGEEGKVANGENERLGDDQDTRMDGVGNDRGAAPGDGGLGGGEVIGEDGDGDGVRRERVDRWGVVFAADDMLEEKKRLFNPGHVSVHVYSLSPAPISDPTQFIIPNTSIRSHPETQYNTEVYGTFTGDAFKPAAQPTVAAGVKKEAVQGKKEDSAAAVFGAKKPADAKGIKKEAGQSSPEKKPTTKAAPRPSNSKRKVVTSDTENDEPAPSKPAPKPSTSSSTSAAPSTTKPKAKTAEEEDLAALEAMAGMDDSDDEFSVTSFAKDASKGRGKDGEKVGRIPGKRSLSGRKVRRVKKTKRETDAKGYMVSKDYYTDESYSGESEPEQKPDIKAAPKAAPAKPKPPIKAQGSSSSTGSGSGVKKGGPGAGGKPAGQSTLMGFFKKK